VPVVSFAVVGESDVETDSWESRSELLGGMQTGEGRIPMLAAHVDNAEVGIGWSRLRIQCKHTLEVEFGFVEFPGGECFLGASKNLGGVLVGSSGRLRRMGRSSLCSE
jgi:hypothetical protein